MSSHEMLEVECPSCRAKQDILIWKSVNVTLSPELKEQVFTGKVNYFTCSSCGFEGFVTTPLVYHDMEKKICVNYLPVEYLEDEEYLRASFTPDAKIRLNLHEDTAHLASMEYFHDTHIVFSMVELIRYVLFRDRLEEIFGAGSDQA